MTPICNQIDPYGDPVYIVPLHFDADGMQRGERVAGRYRCPSCGLWWPVCEEPDCWEQCDENAAKWIASGWWGAAVCEDCGLLMITQPDGRGECYQLGGDQ